ncbi:EAL domain-containing protein [Verrucomicrobiota bacterium]
MKKAKSWCLEGYALNSTKLVRFPISVSPFLIGRSRSCELSLHAPMISSKHAEINVSADGLRIRDLGSTNGTFVNRKRVSQDEGLREGDIVHFANLEFRLLCEEYDEVATEDSQAYVTMLSVGDLPQRLPAGLRQFREMLEAQAVTTKFQPIVTVKQRTFVGYEILGRGNYPGLPASPKTLFELAASDDREPELSRLFRDKGLELAQRIPGHPQLFLNTAPIECGRPGLIESLKDLRETYPKSPLVLEIHEGAVTDLEQMRRIRDQISEIDIGLAYDDFGSGQARLLELVEVTPDVLKFDISMIRDIHLAPAPKQQLLGTLVKMAADMGTKPLAEGIETAEEAEVCAELGFKLAQGYYYGKPSDPPPEVIPTTIKM